VDKLVYMANRIGKLFPVQGPEAAVSGTAEHIKKFWNPRTRAAILRYVAEGGRGLDLIALQAQPLRGCGSGKSTRASWAAGSPKALNCNARTHQSGKGQRRRSGSPRRGGR
jgi:formate dehydrogenase subunit delta